MSTTNLFSLGSEPGEIGECRNSWRGAMYVWTDIAKRYFGLDHFPFCEPDQSRVWNASSTQKLPEHEAIVLLSTMDNAVVYAKDVLAVADAFAKYGNEHPNSSLAEQAEILREVSGLLKPGDAIAWQQTSVGEFWGGDWDEDADAMVWYDPATGTKHFDVLEAARRP